MMFASTAVPAWVNAGHVTELRPRVRPRVVHSRDSADCHDKPVIGSDTNPPSTYNLPLTTPPDASARTTGDGDTAFHVAVGERAAGRNGAVVGITDRVGRGPRGSCKTSGTPGPTHPCTS